MAKSHKIEYDVGSNPEGTSSQQVSDVYYDDSGTPVPQIQTTDLGKVLTAGTNDPVWAEGEGGGTWGSITGEIEDQTDLITILDEHGDDIIAIQQAYVTKDTAQTLTGAKTWTDSSNSTIINGVRMDNVLTSGSNKYEARTQPNGYRSAYIDSSSHWSGFRIMSPDNPATDPRSKLYHYVTRNGTQQTYTIQLPEGSGTLALADGEWTLKYDWDLAAIQAGEKDVDFTGCDEMIIVSQIHSASTRTSLYGKYITANDSDDPNATYNCLMIYSTCETNGKYRTTCAHWIDNGFINECVSCRNRDNENAPTTINGVLGNNGVGYTVIGYSLSQLKKLYIDSPETLDYGTIKIYAR